MGPPAREAVAVRARAEGGRWPLLLALLLLAAGWLGTRSLSQAEPDLAVRPLAAFPQTLEGSAGAWEGRDLEMDQEVLKVLKLSDYLLRAYRPVGGAADAPPVWLYVGFYRSQRTGATYHSPRNCLPGSGWQFVEAEPITVSPVAGEAITVNRVLVERGTERQAILYWYQDRGRVIASEYRAKAYLMWDALTRHRTDGALVRISTPVKDTDEAAVRLALDFLRAAWPSLRASLPE